MSKKQNYQNRGRSFRKLTAMMSVIYAMTSNVYNKLFHNRHHNTGKAGSHLDTSYHSGGGSGGNTKQQQSKHKATIERKRRRKEIQKSKRINRKRSNGVCSFKAKA